MKVAKLVKIISVTLSVLLLLIVGLAAFVLTRDPNDYKPQIENLAREQGVDLQIKGELGWQIYPSIALELNDVALATEQPGMALMASLELAQLNVNLWPLFSGELSVRGINVDGVNLALTETVSEQPQPDQPGDTAPAPLPRIGVERIALNNLNIFYQPLEEDVVSLEIAELAAEQFNLEGDAFPLSLALNLDYSGQRLHMAMSSSLTLNLPEEKYRLETEDLEVSIAGESPVDSRIHLVADVDMASGNWQLNLNEMQVDDLSAMMDVAGTIEPLTAKGSLELAGGSELIGRLTATDLLRELALKTNLDYSPESVVLTALKGRLNETDIEAELTYFFDGQTTSLANIRLGQMDADQYLPAESEDPAPATEQNPLAFLESVPPFKIQLSVNALKFSGYDLSDLRMEATIAASKASVALQHAGFADGDIQTDLILQASAQPQVQIRSFRANNLQLEQFVVSETGEPLVTGEATAAFSGTLASLMGEDFLSGLNGDGLASVDGLYLPNWNIEQNICVSAERLGATAALQSNWPAGTEFASFSSPIMVRDGIATLEQITSGFGNIAFTGGGNFDLVSMDLSAQLALLIKGERTSEQGCSINRYVRNIDLPLSCEGNIGEGGEMSCGLDNAVIQALLAGRVQNSIQERLQRLIAPPAEDEEAAEEEVVDPTQQLFQDALKGILRPRTR